MTKPPFEKVIAQHGRTVLRVVRAVVGAVDADDAWSETFLAAMRAYPDLPADANIEAWLVTIAHRKAIDLVRAAARRAIPVARATRGGVEGSDRRSRPRSDGRRWPHCHRNSVTPWPTTTSPVCPTPRSPQLLGTTADAARRAAADGVATLRRTYPVQDLDIQ